VDLPTVGKSKQRPEHVIEVVVGSDELLKLRLDGKDAQSVALRGLAARVREVQGGDANTPVVISADKAVKYEAVVKVMDTLQRAGVQRVGLSVKSGGS
jgi:biopolymer transport protein TolR